VSDKPWKQFERDVAAILGGERFWANSGEKIDVESKRFRCQCKHVARMSLGELTDLALEAQHQGFPDKVGIVAVKLRSGSGRKTPTLFVLTEAAWNDMRADARADFEALTQAEYGKAKED